MKIEAILEGPVMSWAEVMVLRAPEVSQHFLNFLPDPHGQGSFLLGFVIGIDYNG